MMTESLHVGFYYTSLITLLEQYLSVGGVPAALFTSPATHSWEFLNTLFALKISQSFAQISRSYD